jgi:hypothetical protein
MILQLSPSRLLFISPSPPPSLPLFSGLRSWRSHDSGWLSIRSLRLPSLWLLYIRHLPTKEKLEQLRLL